MKELEHSYPWDEIRDLPDGRRVYQNEYVTATRYPSGGTGWIFEKPTPEEEAITEARRKEMEGKFKLTPGQEATLRDARRRAGMGVCPHCGHDVG